MNEHQINLKQIRNVNYNLNLRFINFVNFDLILEVNYTNNLKELD